MKRFVVEEPMHAADENKKFIEKIMNNFLINRKFIKFFNQVSN